MPLLHPWIASGKDRNCSKPKNPSKYRKFFGLSYSRNIKHVSLWKDNTIIDVILAEAIYFFQPEIPSEFLNWLQSTKFEMERLNRTIQRALYCRVVKGQ